MYNVFNGCVLVSIFSSKINDLTILSFVSNSTALQDLVVSTYMYMYMYSVCVQPHLYLKFLSNITCKKSV